MADEQGGFPIGRFLSLLVVVSLLAFPIVSCGPIEFMGHQIVRNKPPDFEGITRGLEDINTSLEGVAKKRGVEVEEPDGPSAEEEPPGESSSEDASSDLKNRKTLFQGANVWLHWLYLALVLIAVVSFFGRPGSKARAWLGVLGAGGLLLFLSRFESALLKEDAEVSRIGILDWDTGAYLALLGFGLMIFEGYFKGGRRTAAAPAEPPRPLGGDREDE